MSYTKEQLLLAAPVTEVSMPDPDHESLAELVEMLRYCRPAGSATEEAFIERFIDPLGTHRDDFGNRFVEIGDTTETPILWSCHTDTVHMREGLQLVEIAGAYIRLPDQSPSACLGADCTSGVWLMIQMIRAGVPGLYVFHRAEEIGCNGAKHILENNPRYLDGIKYAIAFDRKEKHSIITEQAWSVTASDAFAESLAKLLDMGHKPDPNGIWTDTNTYKFVIPECTNLSVGYYGQHTKREMQDWHYLFNLRDVICSGLDWSQLVCARDPSAVDDDARYTGWGMSDNRDYEYYITKSDPKEDRLDAFIDLIKRYPDIAAMALTDWGYELDDFRKDIFEYTGRVA